MLKILYASQTGNAQDLAETLSNELFIRTLPNKLHSIDNYDIADLLHDKLVIFICSTTGQGDEPDNMKIFWKKLLKKNNPKNLFEHLNFMVVGLGNSTYTKYNYVAKKLNNRLKQLSSKAILPPQLIDDQDIDGPEIAINRWMEMLFKHLKANFFPYMLDLPSALYLKPCIVKDRCVDENKKVQKTVEIENQILDCPSPNKYVTIVKNERVTPITHFQDVRLIKLKLSQPLDFKINPFDVISIYPQNQEAACENFLNFTRHHLKNHQHMFSVNSSGSTCHQNLKDYAYYVRHFLDFQSVPRRSFFRFLAYFATLIRNLLPELKLAVKNSTWAANESVLSSINLVDQNMENVNLNSQGISSKAEHKDIEDICQTRLAPLISELMALIWTDCDYNAQNSHGLDQIINHELFNVLLKKYFPNVETFCMDHHDIFYTFAQRIDLEAERLLELCSPLPDQIQELYNYCNRPKRTHFEVLQDFPFTAKSIPSHFYLSIIPSPIRPRDFSIAAAYNNSNCPDNNNNQINKCNKEDYYIEILVAIVEYKTKLYIPRRGLCSFWLSQLPLDAVLKINIKRGFINIPDTLLQKPLNMSSGISTPLIMVGPGTGVAPLRFLIRHRVYQGLANNYLFFGCRNSGQDTFFASEFEQFTKQGYLTTFYAFSRDQEEKIYVQHLIRQQSQLIYRLIQENASVFICGRSKQMPDQVLDALAYAFEAHGNHLDKTESLKIINQLVNRKQIQMETWS